MTDDSYAQGVREIEALRARLRALEAMAAQPRGDLEDAVGAAMNTAQPPVDPARRKLDARARGFQADPSMEDALRQRAAMGAPAYAAEMQRVGASNGLEMALYESSRTAAIATGAWTPSTDEGDAA